MPIKAKPPQSLWWPVQDEPKPTSEIIRMYGAGYVGAWAEPETTAGLWGAMREMNDGVYLASDLCTQLGYADSGAGKLVLNFLPVSVLFPGRYPGAAQERGDCLPKGTVVLGSVTKPIEDVRVGDVVYTGMGRLTRVISTRSMKAKHPIVKIKAVGLPEVSVTSDHKMLVYRMPTVCGKRVNPSYAARAASGSVRINPQAAAEVAHAFDTRRAEWVAASELTADHCLLTPARYETEPGPSLIDCHAAEVFVGVFLGDGNAHGRKITICNQSRDMLKGVGDWSVDSGMCSSYTLRRHKTANCWQLNVSSRQLSAFCRSHFYGDHKEKLLPTWCYQMPGVFEGLMATDGFERDGVHIFDSTSMSLAYGVNAMAIIRGYEPTIGWLSRSKNTYANAKPLLRVMWRDGKRKSYSWRDEEFVVRPIRAITFTEEYPDVFDIGVEDEHHSFIANSVAISNCVSHGAAGAACTAIAQEIWYGLKDEVTGVIEGVPQLPAKGITEGVVSSAYQWWCRRSGGDGWSCGTAANTLIRDGVMLMKDYPELGFDLTEYSYAATSKYARSGPPSNALAVSQEHQIRKMIEVDTIEALRDLMYSTACGVFDCGSQGWSNRRDEWGVSVRSGSWAHSMKVDAVDDRDVVKQKYGDRLVLSNNNWGNWNSGGRDIIDSAKYVPETLKQRWAEIDLVNPSTGNIMIPKGSCWIRERQFMNRYILAMTGAEGWKQNIDNILV